MGGGDDVPASASGGNHALGLLSGKTRPVHLFNQTFPTQVERTLRIGPDAGKKSGAAARGRCVLDPGSPAVSWESRTPAENVPPSRVKGRRRRFKTCRGASRQASGL